MAVMANSLPANVRDTRDMSSIPGLGKFPGEGNNNPFQYSCMGNPTDRGDQWAMVHWLTESDTAELISF